MDIDNRGFYNFDLNIQLENAVDSYEQDRQRYWDKLGGWSATEYDQAERFAEAVLKNSEKLIPIEEIDGDLSKLQSEISKSNDVLELIKRINDIANMDIPWDKKSELICDLAKECPPDPQDDESPLKLVWERFIIDMSWEAIGKIVEGASRICQLYKLVLCSAPSKSTQMFLSRLSRCYIWGFDPECVMLCRAVIDTAFHENVTPDMCIKHPIDPNRPRFNLANRIYAARKEGLIDDDIEGKADKVRLRGNHAVHEQPSLTKDVWGTICDTVAVLERITQGK